MSNKTHGIDEHLYQYLLQQSLRESFELHALREETSGLAEHNMQIAPEQGQFMAFLAKLVQAKRVLEIGTFTGYSALAVAEAMPEDGKILCCDIDEEFTSIALKYWKKAGQDHKIELKLQPALKTLNELEESGQAGTFDMVFIDADKVNYDAYYEGCLTLVRSGGVILIDNVLWSGRVADDCEQDEATQAIRALNAKLAQDERIDLSMLPVADGLSIARKRQ